jgi:hypothetical protein
MNNDIFNLTKESFPQEFNPYWIGPGSNAVWTLQGIKKQKFVPYHDDDGYYITKNVGDAKKIDKRITFTYKINKHGFRSNHFNKLDQQKISILTGGCSHSFGFALPEELRWQSFLLQKLNNKNIELFDLSSVGASIFLIVRNVLAFIKQYGIPNYLFLVFPDLARNFYFNYQANIFTNVSAHSKHITNNNNLEHQTYSLHFNEYNEMMLNIQMIWFLEELCKAYKIIFRWTTWDYNLKNFFNNIEFNNFLYMPTYNLSTLPKYQNNDNNFQYWEKANDKSHMGSMQHLYIADSFIEAINDKNI